MTGDDLRRQLMEKKHGGNTVGRNCFSDLDGGRLAGAAEFRGAAVEPV